MDLCGFVCFLFLFFSSHMDRQKKKELKQLLTANNLCWRCPTHSYSTSEKQMYISMEFLKSGNELSFLPVILECICRSK